MEDKRPGQAPPLCAPGVAGPSPTHPRTHHSRRAERAFLQPDTKPQVGTRARPPPVLPDKAPGRRAGNRVADASSWASPQTSTTSGRLELLTPPRGWLEVSGGTGLRDWAYSPLYGCFRTHDITREAPDQ